MPSPQAGDSSAVTSLYNRSILSMDDLSRQDIEQILWTARLLKEAPRPDLLRHKVVASCFFEASTRTRLSFEAAVLRLGGGVTGFADGSQTAMACKGESLADAMRVTGSYVHALILRHPEPGVAALAHSCTDIPVINAGDGDNEHPTQALTDLFTIHEKRGSLDGLSLTVCGDLKYSRTVHSLVRGLCHFREVTLTCLAPEALALPESLIRELNSAGGRVRTADSLESALQETDILYMTRVQKERFQSTDVLQEQAPFQLTAATLRGAPAGLHILHPLPRREELPPEIDQDPRAAWFQQAANGLWVRQALLALILTRHADLQGPLSGS